MIMGTQSASQYIATADQPGSQPIMRWRAAMAGSQEQAFAQLRTAYQESWPTQGELIFTGACEFACQHCIYAPSFTKHNRGLSTEAWGRVIGDMGDGLGINTFVYGGRSVTSDGIDVLTQLRKRKPDAHIGLIDNGISMLPVRERLAELVPDWIDISLDGEEKEHDLQRGRNGSYRAGFEGALWLVRNGVAPKVNILSCLTTINQHSIIPMIRELNERGFKNFFITPVTIVDGTRPSFGLQLSDEELAVFVDRLRTALDLFDDAWVEINLFSATYAENIARLMPEIWRRFSPDRDGLVWREENAAQSETELFIRYNPVSLTGTRELIVNTNGDVIVPKSMAQGKVAQHDVVGNLLRNHAQKIVEGLPLSPAFDFYWQEFMCEKSLLKEYW